MMKLAILALVALSGVALAARENIYEKEGFTYKHEERTGVFRAAPFVDLYKQYAVAFVVPGIVPRIADHDPRNYRPSYDVCRDFFAVFVNEDNKIYDFDQFVVLDACLGYVLDGHFLKDEDAPEQDKRNFEALAKKPEIVSLYQTRLGSATNAEKTCVADLLMRAILAKKQYPEYICNNHMIQIYLQFAECQDKVIAGSNGDSLLGPNSEDPYIRLLYQLLRDRVDVCVEQEVAHIENAVRARFAKRSLPNLRMAKLTGNKQKLQQIELMWPNEIVKVLAVVQNTTGEINFREVHQIVSGYSRDDRVKVNHFLDHLAYYATQKIKPRRDGGGAKSKGKALNDPTGALRYEDLINDLCTPFRVSSSEKHYNFALSLIRLAQLLKHKELVNVSLESFLEMVVQRTREAGPVYMSIYSCNLMTYTQGTYSNTGSGKPEYRVKFKPDISKMVVWPTDALI